MNQHNELLGQLGQIAATLGMPVSAFYQPSALTPLGSHIPEINRIMVDLLRALEAVSDPKARKYCTDKIGQAILHLEQAKVGSSKTEPN